MLDEWLSLETEEMPGHNEASLTSLSITIKNTRKGDRVLGL